jgi:hypothetical protein
MTVSKSALIFFFVSEASPTGGDSSAWFVIQNKSASPVMADIKLPSTAMIAIRIGNPAW